MRWSFAHFDFAAIVVRTEEDAECGIADFIPQSAFSLVTTNRFPRKSP